MDIKDCIVPINAMGVQKNIANEIIKNEADFIQMEKDNQNELKQQVDKMFDFIENSDTHTYIDAGHDWVETRRSDVISNLIFMVDKEDRSCLKRAIKVQSEQHDK